MPMVRQSFGVPQDSPVVMYRAPDPLACGHDGNALHLAVWFGQRETAAFLLECDVDPRATAEAGETPLHFAALKGFEEIAAMLLDRGADANAGTAMTRANAAAAAVTPAITINTTRLRLTFFT